MNTEKTNKAAEFIAKREYRDHLHSLHASIYDALIERFKQLPDHIDPGDTDVLTEVGSFLINQGVIVEILENTYGDETFYVIDIAYEADACNVTHLSNGSAQQFRLLLCATDFADAVSGISEIMISKFNA